jgi:Tfp pilus assembly protein FimT
MSTFAEFLVGVVVIAIIYMLVRPSSAGPAIVGQVSDALSDLIRSATGYGTFTNGTATNS